MFKFSLFSLVCFLIKINLYEATFTPRVFNGQKAFDGQFPYLVQYNRVISGKQRLACGGALIHAQWVLLAGHCLKTTNTYVQLGYVTRREWNGVPVIRQIRHGNFISNATETVNDIGLVKLKYPVEFNRKTPDHSNALQEPVGREVWGYLCGARGRNCV